MNVTQQILVIVMNTRLMMWNKNTRISDDTQGAFQKGKGAEEFVLGMDLHIHQQLSVGREYLIIAHIYIAKAYDRVTRRTLWVKLWHMGIRGKFWRMLQNIYTRT